MPRRVMNFYEIFSRSFPYAVGLAINLKVTQSDYLLDYMDFRLVFFKIILTCFSMLSGALFVHYLKPVIVKRIKKFKKKSKI